MFEACFIIKYIVYGSTDFMSMRTYNIRKEELELNFTITESLTDNTFSPDVSDNV